MTPTSRLRIKPNKNILPPLHGNGVQAGLILVTMNSISDEQFYQLLSLKLSGDATAEELALLDAQLRLNPQWQFLYDQMMAPPSPVVDSAEHTPQAYAAHITKMQLQGMLAENEQSVPTIPAGTSPRFSSGRKRLIYSLAIAATVVVIIIGSSIWNTRRQAHDSSIPFNEIVTQKGSRSSIKLPDGTRVWLNADSKLTYGGNFSETNREVTLVGEAYFDVDHNGAHPFTIHTGKEDIRVLGTAFNVRNYPEDKFSETTLISGKIEIAVANSQQGPLILRPLEKFTVSKTTDSFYKNNIAPVAFGATPVVSHQLPHLPTNDAFSKKDSIIAETAWLLDKMVFVNERLANIGKELERHFAITVVFRNPKVEEFRYTGVFDNIGLEKVLTILRESKRISYHINGKTLTIE